LKYGWANFIRAHRPWQWFATFTFKYDLKEDPALRRFGAWVGRLTQALRDSGSKKPKVKYVLAVEWTHLKRVHLHALLSSPGLDRLNRLRWAGRWTQVGGGYARIYPALGRAWGYLSKEIAKGGQIHFGGGPWRDRKYRELSQTGACPISPPSVGVGSSRSPFLFPNNRG